MNAPIPLDGLDIVWRRLRRPLAVVPALEALLGIGHRSAVHLTSCALATSPEAEDLLARMHRTIRSLAVATTDTPQRCFGEIRGPVMWAETMSARSATAGDPGLFVCAMPSKAFDTEPNRLLRGALKAIRAAGREAEIEGGDDDLSRRARHNGHRALRFVEHQSLAAVTDRPRLDRRSLRRTRGSRRRASYEPAVRLLARAAEPVGPVEIRALREPRTAIDHDLLGGLLLALDRAGRPVQPLRSEHGMLVAGPLSYVHPAVAEAVGRVAGVRLGDIAVELATPATRRRTPGAATTPAHLARRAGGRRIVEVMGPADLDRVVAEADLG